jgi:hypothetical protein
MKITFKNNVVTVYSAADAAIFKPYMLANMKHICISEDVYVLPDHFHADVEKIIDDMYYDKEGCIGCGNERCGGAAGYCAPCWMDVFGCAEDEDY